MRRPKLRKKKVGKHAYRYTDANGGAYFGKVGEVPYETAKNQFGNHLKKKQAPAEGDVLTVGHLFVAFLKWVKDNRSDAQYRRRRRGCSRFGRFVYEGRRRADFAAVEVTEAMLEAWRENLKSKKQEGVEGENDRDKRGSSVTYNRSGRPSRWTPRRCGGGTRQGRGTSAGPIWPRSL